MILLDLKTGEVETSKIEELFDLFVEFIWDDIKLYKGNFGENGFIQLISKKKLKYDETKLAILEFENLVKTFLKSEGYLLTQ